MTYQSSHVLIKSPKEGYNAVADQYGKFHEHLNGFDRGFFLRLLPRVTKDLDVIDLWAGDGRIYTLLKKYPFKTYTACDIAEKLLKKHPWGKNVKKTVCDLDAPLPFVDETFDLSFCFFVLEHIVDLEKFFAELYRITKTWWTSILWYFLQRREFVWKANKDQFKVAFYNHRIQDIENAADKAFFKVKLHEIVEKGFLLGWDIQLTK